MGIAETWSLGHTSYIKVIGKSCNQRRGKEGCLMEKKEEVERGCFELESVSGDQEFRVMMVSHWLSCSGS